MVFQEPSLLGMTVRENLRLPFTLRGALPRDLGDRMDKAMKLAGLEGDLIDRDETRLSVGQKQRATLARTLMTEPDILLLDEPTSGLDPRAAEHLMESLGTLNKGRGLTVIMVTHRVEEAKQLGDRMAVLIGGRVAAEGEVSRLLSDPPEGPVREFLRGGNDRG
jgi:putative ABC transport system ATP-binding protein